MIYKIYGILFVCAVIVLIINLGFGYDLTTFDFKAFINGFNKIPSPTEHLPGLLNLMNSLNKSIDLLGALVSSTDINGFPLFAMFDVVVAIGKTFIGLNTAIYFILLIIFDNLAYVYNVLVYILSFIISGFSF